MDDKVTEILEDLFFIERGYLNANHFLYRGRPPVLIDINYKADFEATRRIYARHSIDIGSVRTIITTHCHCDHIGGNRLIQKAVGVTDFTSASRPDRWPSALNGCVRTMQGPSRCAVWSAVFLYWLSIAQPLLQRISRSFDQRFFAARKVGNFHERYIDYLKPFEKE